MEERAARPEPAEQAHQLHRSGRLPDRGARTGAGQIRRRRQRSGSHQPARIRRNQDVDKARGIRYGRDLPERERELLLAEKNSAYIDITEASYKTKLRYLANKAKTIVEETGANNLYLAFGMLNWRFSDRDLRSPLVLVPVSLTTEPW